MKTKYWIMFIILILAVCLGLSFLCLRSGSASDFVQVISDGTVLYTLPLREDRTVTVKSIWGTNTLTVKNDKVAVTDASCPDKYCMKRHFCSSGPDIVCLPNRLVLHFTDTAGVDMAIG